MGRSRTRSEAQPVTMKAAHAFPMREYIGAMALEMARMARDEGDGTLALLLEQAAAAAGQPVDVSH